MYFKRKIIVLFAIFFLNAPASVAYAAEATGEISLVSSTEELIDQNPGRRASTVRVMTYNEGSFVGSGYETGTENLKQAYRSAVNEVGADIVMIQDDIEFFNVLSQQLPKDAIYDSYDYYVESKINNYEYHYLRMAANIEITNILKIPYQTEGCAHKDFLVGHIVIHNREILLVNVHLDWQDIARRHKQIQEIIEYCKGHEYAIIGGDMNPGTRVNGEYPEGFSSSFNYYNGLQDYSIWENAGFKVGNGRSFGFYPTLAGTEYTTFDNGQMAAYDNIIVSSNIEISKVGRVKKPYMNDHYIFFADLIIS